MAEAFPTINKNRLRWTGLSKSQPACSRISALPWALFPQRICSAKGFNPNISAQKGKEILPRLSSYGNAQETKALSNRRRFSVAHRTGEPAAGAQFTVAPPQHFLYFFPDPHGHDSFRPTLESVRLDSGLNAVLCRKYRYAAMSPAAI